MWGDCVLMYQGRLCTLDVDNFKVRMLEEDNGSRYSIHAGSTMMYRDLREVYWLDDLKRNITEFVSKCRIANT